MAKLTAKNFKYTHYMTLEEWKQWKENFDNQPDNKGRKYKDVLFKYDNFWHIIADSFFWSTTPKVQGGEYWAKIANRTSPINQNKPCKK
jgi:hypothetical protein